jgi:hypothetical protein
MLASTRSVESTAVAVQLALCGSIPITTRPDTMVLLISPTIGDEEGTPTFSPTGLSQATPRPAVAGTQAPQSQPAGDRCQSSDPEPPPRRSWLQTRSPATHQTSRCHYSTKAVTLAIVLDPCRVARGDLTPGLPQNRLCRDRHNRWYVPCLVMLRDAVHSPGSSCATRCRVMGRST